MSTLATIGWTRATQLDGTRIHTASRAGWRFVIRTPPGVPARLTAEHQDGRKSVTHHPTHAAAKAAVFGIMRPSEAMGWTEDRVARRYTASWDEHSFTVQRDGSGDSYFTSSTDGKAVLVAGVRDAQHRAARILDRLYGADLETDPAQKPVSAVDELEAALRAAGIRFTARQLAIAALTLGTAVPGRV